MRMASGETFSLQKHSYVSRSKYLEQLERYEKLFKRKNILVLRSEDLFNKTEIVWEKIQGFLKLKKIPLYSPLPRANAGLNEAKIVPAYIRELLRQELLITALGVKKKYGFGWDWA